MTAEGREQLRSATQAFCDALIQKKGLKEILGHFSDKVTVLEHGLPELAPFLGRTFEGIEGASEYFKVLGETLSFDYMKVTNIFVDSEASKTSVRGKATFTHQKTGQSWDEAWSYVLEFDSRNKIKLYEIWADSGAAYLASRGELEQKKR